MAITFGQATALAKVSQTVTTKVPTVASVISGIRTGQAGIEQAINQATGIDKLANFASVQIQQIPTPQAVLETQLQAIEVKARANIAQAAARINELKQQFRATPAPMTPADADELHGVVPGGVPPSRLSELFASNASAQDKALMKALRTSPELPFPGIIPASFSAQGKPETRGFFSVRANKGSVRQGDLPTDDEAYVPLVFTDLRPMNTSKGAGSTYRTVYFRPFITRLSENFAPEWNMDKYFGRVDPVATYGGTNRTIQLGFKLVCFAPEDLPIIYQKLLWLQSMVYPQYSSDVYFRGPVIRMRIGDVVNALGSEGNRGLPGVITNLDIEYSESIWEVSKDMKMPRNIEVGLSFQALHETPVGLVAGVAGNTKETSFGGIMRSNGKTTVDVRRVHDAFGFDYANDPVLQVSTAPTAEGTGGEF